MSLHCNCIKDCVYKYLAEVNVELQLQEVDCFLSLDEARLRLVPIDNDASDFVLAGRKLLLMHDEPFHDINIPS